MKFNKLPKKEKEEVILDIMHGLCDGCIFEDDCIADWYMDCRQHAIEMAIERSEWDDYVLVEDLDTKKRKFKSRSQVDDCERIIKE